MGSASTKHSKIEKKPHKSKKSNGEVMPFFKKQSSESKKKLQHKLYIVSYSMFYWGYCTFQIFHNKYE